MRSGCYVLIDPSARKNFYFSTILDFIQPGKPMQNGFIE